jgi:hypothetical protein
MASLTAAEFLAFSYRRNMIDVAPGQRFKGVI